MILPNLCTVFHRENHEKELLPFKRQRNAANPGSQLPAFQTFAAAVEKYGA